MMTYIGLQFKEPVEKPCSSEIDAIHKEETWVGAVSLVGLVLLIPAMVVAYYYLRTAMNTYFPVTLTKEKWNIKFLFTVFIVTYVLRLIYALVRIVLKLLSVEKEAEAKKVKFGPEMLIIYFMYVLWDIPCILAILQMHHMNFGHKEKRSNSVDESESLASESENLITEEETSSQADSRVSWSVNSRDESFKNHVRAKTMEVKGEDVDIKRSVDEIVKTRDRMFQSQSMRLSKEKDLNETTLRSSVRSNAYEYADLLNRMRS